MARLLLLSIALIFSLVAHATHNRAGEITYRHIQGTTYEIIVTTYTKTSSTQADRCSLTVNFGDGTSEEVQRVNGGPNSANPNCPHWGEVVGDDIKKNEYITRHSFPGNGSYNITMEDPNRNQDILNIDNSVDVVFFLRSVLIITPLSRPNSSPILTNPPIDKACLRARYEHNPGAVDQDVSIDGYSDSLSYKLVDCLGQNGLPIPSFRQPDQINPGPNNNISIDPITGTVEWVAPQLVGEYNIAIEITEWRFANGAWFEVGRILRDMQIDVVNCINEPPVIDRPNDTCVTATDEMILTVTATDPNPGDLVEISATGEPFEIVGSQAVFPTRTALGSVSSTFRWRTECQHIRLNPYYVIFRAVDENQFDPAHVGLTDYETWEIQVVPPSPTHPEASPQGSGFNLSWNYNVCNNHSGFKIYRRIDSSGYVPARCDVGIPDNIGYELVTVINDPTQTTFYDDDQGRGLVHGQRYCYFVFAFHEDGSEGYVSDEFCAELKRDVPIVTRVSVNQTNTSTGSDTIQWSAPTELDAAVFPGPYQYRLLRKESTQPSDQFVEVAQSTTNSDLFAIDTIYLDENLNTQEIAYTYRVDLYSNGVRVGGSAEATSIFLNARGRDSRIELTWLEEVPWTNNEYVIYKQNNVGVYEIIDTVSTPMYVDTGLVNGETYCYQIQTIGAYSIDQILNPITNFSQQTCGIPEDLEAPCPPGNVTLEADCEIGTRTLRWTNPTSVCDSADDVVAYNIYYKPFINDEFEIITSINDTGILELELEVQENLSIAGCYAITAVDSFNNESVLSDSVCADNCPIYELPNVFTPGGDGKNDLFRPFPYRQVIEIDLDIFNRWGELVFESKDPDILWEGVHDFQSQQELGDGVYFYTCKVFEHRLEGVVTRELKGHVTLINQREKFPNN
jgi:gliding motility-associated-like protein